MIPVSTEKAFFPEAFIASGNYFISIINLKTPIKPFVLYTFYSLHYIGIIV
jgi:hypothetical protein